MSMTLRDAFRALRATPIVLIAVGAIAGLIPARRAARLDPARVLREG